jgi:2-oxoglutarate dehydrogenase complex dehydrogenase (E1) component-like enzyme
VRGHEVANIDPLGINVRVNPEELDIKSYGFTEVQKGQNENTLLSCNTVTL